MDKLKHTKGQWRAIRQSERDGYSINTYVNGNLTWSTVCSGGRTFDCKDGILTEDDARLISCAPELIEMLIFLYDLLRPSGLIELKMRGLIEKATGLKIEEVLNNDRGIK